MDMLYSHVYVSCFDYIVNIFEVGIVMNFNDLLLYFLVLFSCSRAIANDNKGKQMLMKFGWQEGQGLGRYNAGIQEPVSQ